MRNKNMKEKKKTKTYYITFDIFRVESIYGIEAKNRKEAIEKAKQQSEYNDGATEYKVFEIGIDK